jgi:hypothetical protein
MSLKLKYFVLNPNSSNKEFAHASREAMRAFANTIASTDKDLANDIRDWADTCSPTLSKYPEAIDYNSSIDDWPLGSGIGEDIG